MSDGKINLVKTLSTTIHSILNLTQSKSNPPQHISIKNCFKVLILDSISQIIVSPLIKQGTLNQYNICLTLNINETQTIQYKDVMMIYIVFPSKENLNLIFNSLKNESFLNYSFNFIDNVDENTFHEFLKTLMHNDLMKYVYNINVFPINLTVFHSNVYDINYSHPYYLLNKNNIQEEESLQYIERIANGLFSLMVTTKTSPLIYYRKGWFAKDIVDKIQNKFDTLFNKFQEIKKEFDFKENIDSSNTKNILILLNRDDDLPIMMHHASSLGAVIQDIFGISTIEGKHNKFIVDPVNDFIWNDNITNEFYTAGPLILNDYKKYYEELKSFQTSSSFNKNNKQMSTEELSQESETIAKSIENISSNKIKGDTLNKHSKYINNINEQVVNRNIGQLYEVEYLLLKKRENINMQEITPKMNIIHQQHINNNNINDVFRMNIINLLISKENENENTIKGKIGSFYKEYMKNIINFFIDKKIGKNSNDNIEYIKKDSNSSSGKEFAKNILKKSFSYVADKIKTLTTIEQPSFNAGIINSIACRQDLEGFEKTLINEEQYKQYRKQINIPGYNYQKQNYENVFVFMVGGGILGEFEYIKELLDKNHMNIIYGCDKLYNSEEFLDDIKLLYKQ